MAAPLDGVSAVLDAIPAHIALLDESGTILSVNRAWHRFAEANVLGSASFGVGENYLSVCDTAHGDCADEAAAVSKGIQDVLRGTIETFELDYPCHSPTERRWFRLNASRTAGPVPVRAIVM